MPSRPKSREKTPKALTGEVLQELADLANVPDAQQKSFFESVRLNVQAAWDLDAIVKGGLANEMGTTLHQAALTLYANLGKLNNSERALVERILSNPNFVFDRISSGGLEGLWKTTYQIARLLSVLTDKTPHAIPINVHSPAKEAGALSSIRDCENSFAVFCFQQRQLVGTSPLMRTVEMAPCSTPSRCCLPTCPTVLT